MNRLKEFFAGIPLLADIRSVLSLIVSLVALTLLIVTGVSLVRAAPEYERMEIELRLKKASLERALQAQQENPALLKTEVAQTQATLEYLASAFPSDEQATEQLDAIYGYADEAGVRVTKLEKLINTPEEQVSRVYTARRMLVGATGNERELTRFVVLLAQSALPTLHLGSLRVVPSEGTHGLSVNVLLYSSLFSPGMTPQPTVRPSATPVDVGDLSEQLSQAWTSEDWPLSIELLLQITEAYPEDQNAYGMLYWAYVSNGYGLLDSGHRDEAIIQFTKALGVNPQGQEAADGLTETLGTK